MSNHNIQSIGDAYYAVIDEFMAAINLRWPKALIQHEDFQSKHAVNLLKRYRYFLSNTFSLLPFIN